MESQNNSLIFAMYVIMTPSSLSLIYLKEKWHSAAKNLNCVCFVTTHLLYNTFPALIAYSAYTRTHKPMVAATL